VNKVIPVVEKWNGRRWSLQRLGGRGTADGALHGVSCRSINNCEAVGAYDGVMLAERWNGHAWNFQPTPDPVDGGGTTALSVSCVANGTCEAVGYYYATGRIVTLPVVERFTP
jgi:hypothetical protein